MIYLKVHNNVLHFITELFI